MYYNSYVYLSYLLSYVHTHVCVSLDFSLHVQLCVHVYLRLYIYILYLYNYTCIDPQSQRDIIESETSQLEKVVERQNQNTKVHQTRLGTLYQ